MAATRTLYTLVSRRRRRRQFITYLVADRIEIAQARHCACARHDRSRGLGRAQ